jgi:hypothetical protein
MLKLRKGFANQCQKNVEKDFTKASYLTELSFNLKIKVPLDDGWFV